MASVAYTDCPSRPRPPRGSAFPEPKPGARGGPAGGAGRAAQPCSLGGARGTQDKPRRCPEPARRGPAPSVPRRTGSQVPHRPSGRTSFTGQGFQASLNFGFRLLHPRPDPCSDVASLARPASRVFSYLSQGGSAPSLPLPFHSLPRVLCLCFLPPSYPRFLSFSMFPCLPFVLLIFLAVVFLLPFLLHILATVLPFLGSCPSSLFSVFYNK